MYMCINVSASELTDCFRIYLVSEVCTKIRRVNINLVHTGHVQNVTLASLCSVLPYTKSSSFHAKLKLSKNF